MHDVMAGLCRARRGACRCDRHEGGRQQPINHATVHNYQHAVDHGVGEPCVGGCPLREAPTHDGRSQVRLSFQGECGSVQHRASA